MSRRITLAEVRKELYANDQHQMCADVGEPGCLEYVPVTLLHEQADGRRICANCKRAAVAKAAARAQVELFHDQARLF